MILTILFAIGLVLAIEGLVLALAPSRIEEMLAMLQSLSIEARRYLGLASLAAGVALIWLAKAVFASG